MNKRPEEPRSLLRRLLRQADQVQAQAIGQQAAPIVSPASSPSEMRSAPVTHAASAPISKATVDTTPLPATGTLLNRVKSAADQRTSAQMPVASPIRPAAPVSQSALEPIQPSEPPPRATQTMRSVGTSPLTPIPSMISSPTERLQAENALEELRRKTAYVATEFAEGRINRAQFSSMYAYYNEKRIIIEQLLRRDPDSQAWQQVARSGHTTFLRQHFEARVLTFGVFGQGEFEPFVTQGTMPLPTEATQPILTALYIIQKNRKGLNPISRKATNGHWLVIVPAFFTTALALFSLEPAAQQVLLVRDLHYDFERANRRVLERGVRQPDQLVFPHRALFEQRTDTGPLTSRTP